MNGQTNKVLYLYDGWDIVAVMNGNGQIVETFTRGVGLAGDIGTLIAVTHHAGSWTNGTFYIHNNHRGDIVLTRSGTTINTVTVGSYDYSAFGNLHSTLGTDLCRFKFSSKERDVSTGLSYYGYRFYSPQWQRWANRDPIEERGGLNVFTFVENSPVGSVDILGLFVTDNKGPFPPGVVLQIKQLIDSACGSRFNDFVTPDASCELKNCIKKRCADAAVVLSPLTPKANVGWGGWKKILGDSAIIGGTITLYPLNGRRGTDWGAVAIHEWAHTCNWVHGQKGLAPIIQGDQYGD